MSLPLEIESALREAGLLRGANYTAASLPGGVSCDIWRVGDDGCQVAAMRPLAQNLL